MNRLALLLALGWSTLAAADETLDLPFAWPRETLIPGNPGMAGGLHLMLNGFAQLENLGLAGHTISNAGQSTAGGATHPELTDDWAMIYWRHEHGWVEATMMLNFEPLTVGKAGYPELGQAGEGLWDAQHAHQLFHQVMVAFHPLSGTDAGAASMGHDADVDLALFGGIGSATIGPPVFMHRLSNPGPTVPRKHHKGENPHETAPVFGATLRLDDVWLEGSAFSGKELTPDDSRLYPHFAAPASFAARVRYLYDDTVEVQVSGERLRDQGHGEPDAWQGSASAYLFGTVEAWRIDALLDYGVDVPDGRDRAQSFLVEGALRAPGGRDTFWTRGELNQREEADASISSPWLFASVGYERVVVAGGGLQLGVFAEATAAHIPATEQAFYGADGAYTLNVGLHVFGMWMLGEDGDMMNMAHSR